MALRVHPLTPDRWPDLAALFNARGCAEARGCWCMYYRVAGGGSDASRDVLKADRKAALLRLAAQDPPPGLLGYRGNTPVAGSRSDRAPTTCASRARRR